MQFHPRIEIVAKTVEGRDQRSYLGKLRYLILIAYIKAVSPLLLQLSFSIASLFKVIKICQKS